MTLNDFDTIDEAIEYIRLDFMAQWKAKNWGQAAISYERFRAWDQMRIEVNRDITVYELDECEFPELREDDETV